MMRGISFALLLLGLFGGNAAIAAPKADPDIMTEAHFVKFKPILMSVVQERRITGLLQLEITLKLYDAADWESIVEQRIRIKDKMVRAIAGMTRGAIEVDAPVNINLVASVLQRHVDSVVGAERVEVLITDASTRTQ